MLEKKKNGITPRSWDIAYHLVQTRRNPVHHLYYHLLKCKITTNGSELLENSNIKNILLSKVHYPLREKVRRENVNE